MIDDLLQIVAPHHCCGCDKIGTLLCGNCKYDITDEPFTACIACGEGLAAVTGICATCSVSYDRAWCVGQRHDTLQRLIGDYKFMNMRAAYRPLGELLAARLPKMTDNVVIVPIPTVPAHIRQRGYDHMSLIAAYMAKQCGLRVENVLYRRTRTMQRDADRILRDKQAKQAFACRRQLDDKAIYLIIDDVVTTGATMQYAAQVLKSAGASTVWVATISRQALD